MKTSLITSAIAFGFLLWFGYAQAQKTTTIAPEGTVTTTVEGSPTGTATSPVMIQSGQTSSSPGEMEGGTGETNEASMEMSEPVSNSAETNTKKVYGGFVVPDWLNETQIDKLREVIDTFASFGYSKEKQQEIYESYLSLFKGELDAANEQAQSELDALMQKPQATDDTTEAKKYLDSYENLMRAEAEITKIWDEQQTTSSQEDGATMEDADHEAQLQQAFDTAFGAVDEELQKFQQKYSSQEPQKTDAQMQEEAYAQSLLDSYANLMRAEAEITKIQEAQNTPPEKPSDVFTAEDLNRYTGTLRIQDTNVLDAATDGSCITVTYETKAKWFGLFSTTLPYTSETCLAKDTGRVKVRFPWIGYLMSKSTSKEEVRDRIEEQVKDIRIERADTPASLAQNEQVKQVTESIQNFLNLRAQAVTIQAVIQTFQDKAQ